MRRTVVLLNLRQPFCNIAMVDVRICLPLFFSDIFRPDFTNGDDNVARRHDHTERRPVPKGSYRLQWRKNGQKMEEDCQGMRYVQQR